MVQYSAYVSVYTSVEDVDGFLQIQIKPDTKPSDSDVLKYIQSVEAEVVQRRLGNHITPALTKFDVEPNTPYGKGTVAVEADIPDHYNGVVIVPPYTPIISVNSGTLSINDGSLVEAQDWTVLQEGPGEDTDFIILKKTTNTGKQYGYAFYFYGADTPSVGRERIRGTWYYGYNVDSAILREYVTLKVSEKVILARLFSAQPMNVATYTGGDMNSYVNTQFEVQLKYIRERCKEIEDNYFPVKGFAVSVF